MMMATLVRLRGEKAFGQPSSGCSRRTMRLELNPSPNNWLTGVSRQRQMTGVCENEGESRIKTNPAMQGIRLLGAIDAED